MFINMIFCYYIIIFMFFIIINKIKSTKHSKIKNNLSVAKTQEKQASWQYFRSNFPTFEKK